jgi:putative Mg2+ transporter-C (MgtC) family protein
MRFVDFVAAGVPVGPLVGQGWEQVGELGVALLLSACIGVEREFRQKNAGLRTHTLVGLGAALFMLVSKYGFNDVLHPVQIVLDPSRMAAQIVSGIGFIGAGLIFVRKDAVRGLTTAASIWLVAAVGAAAGAGLVILAALTTVAYLGFITGVFPLVTRYLPRSSAGVSELRVRYLDGRGVLRHLLHATTSHGFIIDELSAEPLSPRTLLDDAGTSDFEPIVEVRLLVHGKSPVEDLAGALSRVDDVASVLIGDEAE